VLKDIRQGYRHSVMHNAVSFGVRCSVFGARAPRRSMERRFWNKSSKVVYSESIYRCLTSRMEVLYTGVVVEHHGVWGCKGK